MNRLYIEIYKEYVKMKADPKLSAQHVCDKFGISRTTLYDVVRQVRHGNPSRVRRDIERARLTALWTHKYESRFLALPKDRTAATVTELVSLIKDMDKDGFPQTLIASKLRKDRSTIIHHLEN